MTFLLDDMMRIQNGVESGYLANASETIRCALLDLFSDPPDGIYRPCGKLTKISICLPPNMKKAIKERYKGIAYTHVLSYAINRYLKKLVMSFYGKLNKD